MMILNRVSPYFYATTGMLRQQVTIQSTLPICQLPEKGILCSSHVFIYLELFSTSFLTFDQHLYCKTTQGAMEKLRAKVGLFVWTDDVKMIQSIAVLDFSALDGRFIGSRTQENICFVKH